MNILKPRLDAICKNPDNHHCADCGARAPRWSSVRLGILICPTCAGIHRKLGTHISFVQSVTMDKWKLEWVETVEKIGNRISNMYFEANIPEHIRKPAPSDTTSTGGDTMDSVQGAKLEKWIRNKYELKLFVQDTMVDPRAIVADGRDPRTTEPYGVSTQSPKTRNSPKKKQHVQASPDLGITPQATPVVVPAASPLILPTNFEWRENVFISSWARAYGVE